MDPNACWRELCELLDTCGSEFGDDTEEEILERCYALDHWLNRGGFAPDVPGMGKECVHRILDALQSYYAH